MQPKITWERVCEHDGDDARTMQALSARAFHDLRVHFRESHLRDWATIYNSENASEGEKERMYRNLLAAVEAAEKGVPYCQDTGTDVCYVMLGENTTINPVSVRRGVAAGALHARKNNPFRSSIFIPKDGYNEGNSGDNSPAEIHYLPHKNSDEIRGYFVCKGGGSGGKLWSFSEKPLLAGRRDKMLAFLLEKIKMLGHSACPPYHLSIVLGGLSHLHNSQLLTRLTIDDPHVFDGENVLRDRSLEASILDVLKGSELGAQGDGKYFVMPDGIRVLRAPRHAAHFFVAVGVSCSAHRIQAFRIDKTGAYLEKLCADPRKYLPENPPKENEDVVHVDLREGDMALAKLRSLKAGQRILLSGPILGARDKAYTRWMTDFEAKNTLPEYLKKHLGVMYVGPADTPKGDVIGSFGPTTASRMDAFSAFLGVNKILPLSIGKGNRSAAFAADCAQYKMLYAAVQGGPAALLRRFVKAVEILDFEDLGMEAVRQYHIERMPVQLVVDAKGRDLYAEIAATVKTP